jgi:hypothetical protein
MREMSTQVGAASGNNGRTEGMPEVQKPVLEHAAPKARPKEISQGADSVKLVTVVTDSLSDVDAKNRCKNSIELAQEIDRMLAQTEKYMARAAYSMAGQLMYEREHKAISS